MIRFDAPVGDSRKIAQIADRAYKMAVAIKNGVWYRKHEIMMDLTACHLNGCPLKLEELLAAPDFDFSHDVFGIRRHLNRTTGQLEDCFLPRCANLESQ